MAVPISCLIGIAPWKRKRIRVMLQLGRDVPLARTSAEAIHLAKARGGAIAGWASRLPPDLESLAASHGVPLYRIEDGFIRSAGLGAALVQPCSLAIDARASHYDSTRPSDLECLLQDHAFSTGELERAERLIERLRTSRITKYNLAGTLPQLPPDRRVVLVLGQVDDDLSVQLGGAGATVATMLEAVRQEERDAAIVFKPHPDVVAGLRQGVATAPGCLDGADADLITLFERAEQVHVLTSLGGFEALLRGCRVVVHGQPFYAGWGLTEDRNPPPRRTRRQSLAELVAAALIAYPVYFDPVAGRVCTVEQLLDRLEAQGRAKRPGRLVQWWGRGAQWLRRVTD